MGKGKKGQMKVQEVDEVEDGLPEEGEEEEEGEEMSRERMLEAIKKQTDTEWAEKFVQGLPLAVRMRIRGMQGQQKEIDANRAAKEQEYSDLLRKYEELHAPIYEKRVNIVKGVTEPDDEMVEKGFLLEPLEEEEEEEDPKKERKVVRDEESLKVKAGDSDEKGLPDFWSTVLKNHAHTGQMIQERDEPLLAHLIDVRGRLLPGMCYSFILEFEFTENEYMTNKVLTKTYKMIMEDEDPILDKAEGCEIDWQKENLTTITKQKKQRQKGGKGGQRVLTKIEPCESFFNFFKPPQIDEEEEYEEEGEDDMKNELIEADVEVGQAIMEDIIPKAVEWYTGRANEQDGFQDMYDMDDDSEDEEMAPPKKKGGNKGGKGNAAAAGGAGGDKEECKQQ